MKGARYEVPCAARREGVYLRFCSLSTNTGIDRLIFDFALDSSMKLMLEGKQ